MEILIAIFHIVAACIAYMILCVIYFSISMAAACKYEDNIFEKTSLKFNIPIDDIKSGEYNDKVSNVMYEMYDSDKFINRMSNLLGVLRIIYSSIFGLILISLLTIVIWSTFINDLNNAKSIWLVFIFGILIILFDLVFYFTSKIIFGRYPGEAKSSRKTIAQLINANDN